jgi:hypothetical protein
LKWHVDDANIDLGNFIFAKAFVYPVYYPCVKPPAASWLNLPLFKGSLWLILAFVFSITCLGSGLIPLARQNRSLTGRHRERIWDDCWRSPGAALAAAYWDEAGDSFAVGIFIDDSDVFLLVHLIRFQGN